MGLESKTKFSLHETLCNVLIWHLRLLSVPLEMLLHLDVGERYLGFSGLLATTLLGVYAANQESSLLNSLVMLIIGRIFFHRLYCIRRRWAGDPPIDSRSPGRSLLTLLPVQFARPAMKWIEPVLVMVTAAITGPFSDPTGEFLLWSGAALLCITLVRANLSYHQMLDALDARIVPEPPVAKVPGRMVNSRRAEPQLLEA
jgi:hypothetical protein